MADAIDDPLPQQLDGEPDLAAEIARLNDTLSTLKADTEALKKSTDYQAVIRQLDSLIPEDQRTEAPANASAIDQVFHKITSALAWAKRPAVPATDTARPNLEIPAEDLSALPPHARMARGYAA